MYGCKTWKMNKGNNKRIDVFKKMNKGNDKRIDVFQNNNRRRIFKIIWQGSIPTEKILRESGLE
jgi:hypothetical protein